MSSSQLSSSQEAVGGDGLTPHMKFVSDITVLDKRDNELVSYMRTLWYRVTY